MKIRISRDPVAGLCASCRNANTVTYDNGHQVTTCSEVYGLHIYARIERPVSHCTEYDNKNATARYDMEKIAWTVTTDKSGMAIGFKPPKPEKD